MQFFLYILTFGLSIGLCAIGVTTSYRMKLVFPENHFSSLFYFQAFSFIYGFYGIWGIIISKLILNNLSISENIIENIILLFPFLGIPFLIASWYLQLIFTFELKSIKTPRYFPILFFSVFSLAFLGAGLLFKYFLDGNISINLNDIIKSILLLNLLISVSSGFFLIVMPHRSVVPVNFLRRIALIFILAPFSLLIFYFLSGSFALAGIFFVLFYFITPALVSALFFLNEKPASVRPQHFDSLLSLCREFGISNRECEIIREICDGKSNREISERLFISLQTVKDHSHRIYSKTGVSSRVQLVNLVNEKIKPGPTPVKP